LKSSSSSSAVAPPPTEFVQNVLDILRVIPSPIKGQPIDSTLCLISSHSNGDVDQDSDDNDSDSSGSSDEDEDEAKRKQISRKRSLTAPTPTASAAAPATKKRRKDYNLSEQVQDTHCHIKLFSKCWVLFFSLPLSSKQIKLSLKHLPEYVIPILDQPLLLADYLSNLVSSGGLVGVLALESLFHLILEYNLDYPNFFNCLYSLLTVEVLSAKYRTKFMNLLHLSLKSSNVPEYTIAGFIKKLAVLSIVIPGPAVMFCLTQVSLLASLPSPLLSPLTPSSDSLAAEASSSVHRHDPSLRK
jgi:hypothetical protein